MRRYLSLGLVVCLICVSATGCANRDSPNTGNRQAQTIDIDLSRLSSIMAYAAVADIMSNPRIHLGRTVRATGFYLPFFWELNNELYHYLLIKGTANCCPQAIEFRWSPDLVFADGFPSVNSLIEVVGVFRSYEELGQSFFYLAADSITIRQP